MEGHIGTTARERLLEGLPVTERRLSLAGVTTAVLEGGDGPPVVLLHGTGGNAAHWADVIPDLVATHRVVAPDLPGQGASELAGGPPDADRVTAWLDELITRTCTSPPALVGNALGGGIAARFAVDHGDRVSRLVLVDALGLAPFAPSPEFGAAITAFLTEPTVATHELLWRHCARDLDGLRARMGTRWETFETYNLDRARTPSVRYALEALMVSFAFASIAAADLDRIPVPTSLIWGRHDLAAPLAVAAAVSARHGWPLYVVEDAADDPPIERPEAFLEALRAALGASAPVTVGSAS